jgi:hypothetical protein
MKKLFVIPVLLITVFLSSCSKEVEFIQPINPKVNIINVNSGIIAKFLFRGNLVDSTIFRNDGVTQNSTFDTDRFNKPNESFYSSNGYMESHNIPFNISKTYTLTMWVKILSFQEGHALLELNKNKRYDGNPIVWMSKNHIYLSQCNKSTNRIKIGFIPDMINKWVNITWIVYNGATVLYVNGERVGVSYWNYPNYEGITLTLGNMGNNGSPWRSQPSDACIDDVKIYDRVLSESEINYISKN